MVSVTNVTRRLGGGFSLTDVSFEIAKGETLVLAGPSGCGKTSLLRLIAGLDRPDGGAILLDGYMVSGPGRMVAPHQRQLAMVFQDLALWPHMTIRRNIEWCLPTVCKDAGDRRVRVESLLKQVNLGAPEDVYPRQLSGGEKQRLALARALASEPRILLLDEPLVSLEPRLVRELCATIKEVQRRFDLTILHVTHSYQDASLLADRLAIMQAGRLLQVGSWSQLVTEPANGAVSEFMREWTLER